MGRFDYYRSGDWNAECDVCGQKYKASKLKLRWDGLRVCPKDFEFRHPQDFVRGVKDNQATPFSRPEPPDLFVTFNWTQFPTDTLNLFDSISKSIYKRINPIADGQGAIGGAALGILSLGGSVPHTITVDDVVLSDTHSIAISKPVTESISIAELVSITVATTTSLGSSALGTHALGA